MSFSEALDSAWRTILHAGPEVCLLGGALSLLLSAGRSRVEGEPAGRRSIAHLHAGYGWLLLAAWLVGQSFLDLLGRGEQILFVAGGAWRADAFSVLIEILVIVLAVATFALLAVPAGSAPLRSRRPGLRPDHGERRAMVLFACAGAAAAGKAADLLTVWLALEVVSAACVVLLLHAPRSQAAPDRLGAEAVMKLFVSSAVASALMLFGLAYLYGVTGSTALSDVHAALVSGERQARASGAEPLALLVPGLLFLCGCAAKLAVFPAHFAIADVLSGTRPSLGGFLLTLPPVAGFAALVRLLVPLAERTSGPVNLLPGLGPEVIAPWSGLLQLVAAVTLSVGALGVLAQEGARRMLAWTGVLHGGLLVAAVSCHPSPGALPAALLILSGFVIAALAVAAVLTGIDGRVRGGKNDLEHLYGLRQVAPHHAASLAIALLCLAGMAPSVSFLGRWSLFGAMLEGGASWLAGIALVASALAAYPLVALAWRVLFARREVEGDPLPALTGAVALSAAAASTVGVLLLPLLSGLVTLAASTAGAPR